MDLDGILALIAKGWGVASSPAGVAILLGILVTQLVKVFDDKVLVKRDLNREEIVAVSAAITAVLYMVLCVLPPWVNEMVGKSLAAGLGAPLLVYVLKAYFKVDINVILGAKQEPPPAKDNG